MERAIDVYQRIKGPVATVNVCFQPDGTLDYAAIRRYVNWLCENKVPILLLTYGSSEFSGLTELDIYRLTEEVAEAVAGRALVIASTGWWPPRLCRDFLQHADRVGADAVKVQVNPSLGKDADTIVGFFDALSDAADIPLLLWSVPPSFNVDVVRELAIRPNIVGMKNDGDQFYDYYDFIRASQGQNFAVISGGQMRNFAFGYQVGSPAYLCTVVSFRPDLALRFYNHLVAGRTEDAWQMIYRYEDPWLQAAIKQGWLGSLKAVLEMYGLYPNDLPQPPKEPLAPDQRDAIRQVVEHVFGPIEPVQF